ncbi:phytoene/squalene synthase family protein [Lichenibacterium ramalinae]|uniref:Phytoene/squalene synthase family protein n=1 Tax=Lichenibacterium ramalinae TaxID=2316527 RepID=A0A4Q2RHT2_9HYPH|nr:phytoene/squalene synthase family protein [Lichenibacterium ramalinae]RYB07835.1 phytoene/squalene synthase family protein [Lichenibacterium ramalinae]
MMDAVSETSRQSIEAGSKSFAAAARLFDPETRDSARLFYAWCRHCDDVIDGQAGGMGRVEQAGTPAERLAMLERRTREALAGLPQQDPAFAAFARVAAKHRIPPQLPLDILDGFRMDVEERSYATLDELLSYCYGVAGAVGVTMAIVMGVDPEDRAVLDRACDLGLAFQLTNIARDVMDDARLGRVYLPAELFRLPSVTPAFVLDPANRRDVVEATHALLELAERYYASARTGIARLPWRSAWAVAVALRVYREIGKRVRFSPDPWARRLSVPTWRKLWHVGIGAAQPTLYRVVGAPPRTGLWTRPPGRHAA